jgi:methylmalonyl-CoA mutase C-terminal domain/subunit
MPPVRVVIAKMGLDSHYLGAIMVARHLADRGMEVVYAGNLLPDAIVATVVQEAPDVLGLSSLSGNHLVMVPRVLDVLRREGIDDVLVVLGGVVPDEDAMRLRELGVARVYGPGSNLTAMADDIHAEVRRRRARPEPTWLTEGARL